MCALPSSPIRIGPTPMPLPTVFSRFLATEAAEALDNLRKEDITELKSFAKPAQLVQDVCSCVVILKGYKDPSWKGSKLMMNESNFLRSLVEFEKDSLTDKQIKQVKQFFQQADFTPEAARDKSMAAAGLSLGCGGFVWCSTKRTRSATATRRGASPAPLCVP